MHRTRRRRVRALVAGGALLAAGAAFAPAPASAEVCAIGRVYVAGSPTSIGTCVPLMETWLQNCVEANVFPLGYGAGATVCAPTPV